MEIANSWEDYQIIDMSNGEKIEKWGNYILRRPDPQIIWTNKMLDEIKVDAIYHRSNKGGGYWEKKSAMKDRWHIKYKDLTFNIKLMGFKHTGIFPEQAFNWDYMIDKIKQSKRQIRVLNLFAYTGAATVACTYAGAYVTHVDSSKGIVDWAKENMQSSNLDDKPVRYIVDDVIKFVEREIRRGHKYDAIIMDPPSFGRGTNSEVWKLEDHLFNLVSICLNITVNNHYKGIVCCGELGLPMKDSKIVLPCGIYGRWENED